MALLLTLTQQPFLAKDLGENWRMVYPDIVEQVSDRYWASVDLIDSVPREAIKALKNIVEICGNGHIDAILDLGFLYNENKKPIEGNALIHKAHLIALDALPKDFSFEKERIRWSELDNRPFLRTFHHVGLELMKEGKIEAAIEKFEFLLKVNPNDNQCVRYLIADCFFALNRYGGFFKLDELFPDDYSIEFLYGKVIAFIKTNQLEEAREQLLKAKTAFPHMFAELKKEKHVFPADEFHRPLSGIPLGSRQEAFFYWERTKYFWVKDKAVKEFLKTNGNFQQKRT